MKPNGIRVGVSKGELSSPGEAHQFRVLGFGVEGFRCLGGLGCRCCNKMATAHVGLEGCQGFVKPIAGGPV